MLASHQRSGKGEPTFSRSGSRSAKASSLLSITEAAATSSGVDPRIAGEAVNPNEHETKLGLHRNSEFRVKHTFTANSIPSAAHTALLRVNSHCSATCTCLLS